MVAGAKDLQLVFAAAGARGCGNGRRVALAKRRSSQGRVVGHLLVPLRCRSAGELVSVNGEVNARVGGRQGCGFAEQ